MKNILKFSVLIAMILGIAFSVGSPVFADEDGNGTVADDAATSISISPVSKVLNLEPDSIYEDSFKVTNNSSSAMRFEVHASPYSYTFSEEDDEYRLGFSNNNSYTQITRWITFKDSGGNYVATTEFKADPQSTFEVHYRISTPSSLPAGGQYAVLFAHTLSEDSDNGGIKTEASPGLVVYGHSSGETVVEGGVRDSAISQVLDKDGEKLSLINGTAKVKNTGNVDFMAQGILKVEGIFGRVYYETPSSQARISIIPEVELTVSDVWEDTPYFGLFKATWTVISAGKTEEPITKMILILPPLVIVIMILLLTIVTIWIIILIRKRKERRSRFVA